MDGYAGKILHLDLTLSRVMKINTEKYRSWGGGHGMGAAVFWDICRDKTITDGRHPANVVCIMASPFCGTIVPSAGGRCEVVGVGVGGYPFSWFTRSNFGGRFSAMLKYAGWDGIVIEGQSDKPLWVDIRNSKVRLRDATKLWGKNTWETQQEIWEELDTGKGAKKPWKNLETFIDKGRTTQKPAVLTIGPAGENQTAHGALIHDAGNGAGQGGFGAVWGAKNLKAISVLGTGSVTIADPASMIKARFTAQDTYAFDPVDPDQHAWGPFGQPAEPLLFYPPQGGKRRPQSCQGCISGCRNRFEVGYGNESSCQETAWYWGILSRLDKSEEETVEINMKAADLVQKYGFNSYPIMYGLPWLEYLFEEGILGPGCSIHSDINWKEMGSLEFAETFIHTLATKQDIGADLSDGWVHAAHKWGRQEDLKTGALLFPYWGFPEHGYDPRAELEWGYASIMGDRDVNLHDFNWIFWDVNTAIAKNEPFRLDAETLVRTVAVKLGPYAKDRPEALDFSDANMYSEPVVQLVRWMLHYSRFWKQSALLCDFRWPDLYNTNSPDLTGITGSTEAGEQVFWKAITGEDISLEDGIENGRRIWNLCNAIWTLQGRHRDMVHFAPYIYETEFTAGKIFPFYHWPVRDEKAQWSYQDVMGRSLDKAKFEEWKSTFYRLEGWDESTGWPHKRTLEELDLGFVAEVLQSAGKLNMEE